MNELLQQHIAQAFAPSMEAFDPIELLSLESSARADLVQMGRSIAMADAIDALAIDQLSNEAYQVAIESIFTAAEVDIPVSVAVPSFESSQALALTPHGTVEHHDKVEKKKGLLKRIWAFIQEMWQKLKAKLKSIFTKKKQHVDVLLLQQKQYEAQGAAMGYTFKLGHEPGDKTPPSGDHTQAPGGHIGQHKLGFSAPKKINIGVLGKDPAGVAAGAETVAGHVKKLTGAVTTAFQKLLTLDYANLPASAKELAAAVGGYNDTFNLAGTHISMSIGRMGAQVNVQVGGRVDFEAHPDKMPVRELLHARHTLVNAWDEHTKGLEQYQKQLDMLEGIAKKKEGEAANITDPAALTKAEAEAGGLQRAMHYAGALLGAPVEHILQPGISEIDRLLGVK